MASQIDEADGMNILVLSFMLLAVAFSPTLNPWSRQWRYPQLWAKIIKNYSQQAQRR
ncbi:hypothetical protein [Microcoleus vaginatus]|uniref:hypothetical protein n=1 Tax=Microcoleus vaginatus TaxID=119532 RepID=UPI0032A32F39